MSVHEPNYTQVPNAILDALAGLTDPELRVALVVCRQTFGWHRQKAVMSISYLVSATGVSNVSVIKACDSLVEKGMLVKEKSTGNRGANVFSMVVVDLLSSLTGKAPDPLTAFTGTCEPASQQKPSTNKGKESKTKQLDLPTALDTPDFETAWADWLAYRKERRLTLSLITMNAQLKKLAGWGAVLAVAAIRQSIENGWQGLFEPRGSNGKPPPQPVPAAPVDTETLQIGKWTFTRDKPPVREHFTSEETFQTYMTAWRKKFGGAK